MSLRKRSVRFARHGLLRATSVVLILAAALVGILRLSLPWLAAQPDLVAAMLSDALRTPVRLAKLEARWASSGPVLTLHELALGDSADSGTLDIQKAEISVDLLGGLLPGRHWVRELAIDQLALEFSRDAERWSISGLPLPQHDSGASGKRFSLLERLGAVRLRAVALTIRDDQRGLMIRPPQGDLLLLRRQGQLQIGARLGSGDSGMLGLVMRPDEDGSSGSGYVSLDVLQLQQWRDVFAGTGLEPRFGSVSGQIWLSWTDGKVNDFDATLDFSSAALAGAAPIELAKVGQIDVQAAIPDGRLLAQLHGAADGSQQAGLWWQNQDESEAKVLAIADWAAEGDLDLRLNAISIKPLADLLMASDRLPAKARSALYSMNTRGKLERLHLNRGAGGHWWLEASLSELGYDSDPNRWPGAEGLAFDLLADADGLWLRSQPASVQVEWRQAWPEPVALDALTYELSLVRQEQGWQLQFERAQVDYAGVRADTRGDLALPSGALPVLQIEAAASGPLAPSRQFWVATKMSPKSIEWLEKALDNGRLRAASMFYRGPPKRWPFRRAQGRFELAAIAEGVHLDYHADWPPAERLEAHARIVNRGLIIDKAQGEVMGVAATASGGIANFKAADLDLAIDGQGDAGDLLAFLKASPLQHRNGSVLIGMEASGRAGGQARLRIPLSQDSEPSTVAGEVALSGVDFRDAKWSVRLDDVRGTARFTTQGFAANGLNVKVGDARAALDLALGPFTGDPQRIFNASLRGMIEPAQMFADYEVLRPILDRMHGASSWRGSLYTSAEGQTELLYESDLLGTSLDLPMPLAKPAEESRALRLEGHFQTDQPPRIDLQLGTQLNMAAQLPGPQGPFAAALQFGGEVASLPQSPGLRIAGETEILDISGWATWLGQIATRAGGEFELAGIDLKVAQLGLMGGSMSARSLTVNPTVAGWQASVQGDDVSGTASLDRQAEGLALIANFERLLLPSGAADRGPSQSVDPRWMPALHLLVKDFALGQSRLGEVRVEAFPTSDGLRFDQLQARSAQLDLVGSGNWRVDPQGQAQSQFELRFTAEDLGDMLAALGFGSPVEGGQTLASIQARWQGAPVDFGLERLQGTLEVSVGSGRLVDVKPGAGRVFGLFSIRELPRRLALDFRDIFKSGLAFNEISGLFQLSEGNAWTQNLVVRGPAADILIFGRTGLAVRDYDQEVLVEPRVGGALPVVGALAGGPVGAAAGLLMQGVVGRNLEGINSTRYSVMGTWENPRVERMDRPSPGSQSDG